MAFYRKNILPSIENVPVQELKARALIQVLDPIKARGALETVRRLVEIMIYAVNVGLIDANPASGIGNAFERPKKQHMPIEVLSDTVPSTLASRSKLPKPIAGNLAASSENG